MRKYLRAMARAKMKKAGYVHVNRKQANGRSFFSTHWREFARK